MAVLRKLNTEINLSGDGDKELRAWIKDLVDARKEGVSMSGGIDQMEKEMIDAARQIGLTRDQLKQMADATRKTKEVEAFSSKYGFAMSDIQAKSREAKGAVNNLASAVTALAAVGIGAKLLGTAGEMLSIAGKYEQTAVSFEVMLGSAEKAKDVLKQVNEFSTVTPYSPEESTDSARALLAMGLEAKDLTKTLQKVGDVASMANMPLKDLATIYGKNLASGVVQMEDLNQIAERGIPIMQELSKQFFGNPNQVKQVRELSSKGAISFKDLELAFTNMTSEGGKAFKMMEKQSATYNGLMSTLGGNVGEVKRQTGMMIGDALKPLLELLVQFTGWLTGNETAMTVLKVALLIIVPAIGVLLVGAVIIATIAFFDMAIAVLAATWPFMLIAVGIMALIIVIEDLYTWITGGESVIGSWLESTFGAIPEVISGVFAKVKAFFVSVLDFFKQYGKYFIMAIFPVSAIYFYWDQIVAFFTSMPGKIVAFFSALPGKIMAALSGLKSQLKEYFMGLAPDWAIKLFGIKNDEKQDVEARAGGGPVSGGKPYLVGENGPELFVPTGDGSIVPGGNSGGTKGGAAGGITISPVLNFYGPANREDAATIADKVQKAIKDCIPAVRGMLGLEAV